MKIIGLCGFLSRCEVNWISHRGLISDGAGGKGWGVQIGRVVCWVHSWIVTGELKYYGSKSKSSSKFYE